MGAPDSSGALTAIPLFPLPNAVLFPRAIMTLHIFEQRYKEMTVDVLATDCQIAMAMLRPGWEKTYHDQPEIDEVVCVGRIVSHEKLPDGTFNFLLQGTLRAKVAYEFARDRPYRRAQLEPLVEIPAMEIDLGDSRERLTRMLSSEFIASPGLARQLRKLLEGPWPTADIADLVAYNYFEDSSLKQEVLAEVDVQRRVRRIVSEFESMRHLTTPPPSILRPPNPN